MRALGAGVLGLALLAAPAAASDFWERALEAPRESDGDGEGGEPETFDELLERADEHTQLTDQYYRATIQARHQKNYGSERHYRDETRQAAKQATRYIDKALALRPDEVDLHFRCARLTYWHLYQYYDERGPTSLRKAAGEHAIEHWAEFERLAPDDPRRVEFVRESSPDRFVPWVGFAPFAYQFGRSIIYTKLGGEDNYRRALADYDFLLDAAPRNSRTAEWVATLLTNSAEIYMAIGDIDEAVERYEAGVELNSGSTVYLYGFAVALDRAGFKERALDVMNVAVQRDPDIGELANPDYFFVPKGDVHYYYGLAFEVAGDEAKALLHFREYVDVIEDKRYVEDAREHIERLAKTNKSKKRK